MHVGTLHGMVALTCIADTCLRLRLQPTELPVAWLRWHALRIAPEDTLPSCGMFALSLAPLTGALPIAALSTCLVLDTCELMQLPHAGPCSYASRLHMLLRL